MVLIAQAAQNLADDVSWQSTWDFGVVFGLIWIAWFNGTIYYELHGREDGRTRSAVFLQMLLIALLAVFTADAAGESGRSFALTYSAYLLLLAWLWYSVRRDSETYRLATRRYYILSVVTPVAFAATGFLPSRARLWVWAIWVLAWIGGSLLAGMSSETAREFGISSTHSLVERFGLFIIIVLGEVVVGVVAGLSASDRTFLTVATGMVGLMVGFASWWNYFDFVGRRIPDNRTLHLAGWIFAHLPVAMSVVATGAAMVSLVEHAADQRSPLRTAWLLSGSVAVGLLSLLIIVRARNDYRRLLSVYRPLSVSLAVASVAILIIGSLTPPPLLLVASLVVLLSVVWWVGVSRWLSLEDPNLALPAGGAGKP